MIISFPSLNVRVQEKEAGFYVFLISVVSGVIAIITIDHLDVRVVVIVHIYTRHRGLG